MHNSLSRAQNVFGFFTTVAFVVAALIASSDYFSPRAPTADISVKNVQVVRGRPHYYSTKKEEYASIKFSLNTDFSDLMTWNTKSIYISVAAVWESACSTLSPCASASATNTTNEAVIYDTILTSPSADHLMTISTLGHFTKKEKRETIALAEKQGDTTGKSRGVLKLKNQKPKYTITAPGGKVGGIENVKLIVRYNVQPWVGALAWDQRDNWGVWKAIEGAESGVFDLPHVKVKKVVE